MAARLFGYLTDHHLALYEVGKADWQLVKEFEEENAASIPEFLDRNRPLHLLADVVEMEFRFEKVAFLRGSDRQALHERKLLQAFRSSPFRHSASLGREPGQRGEEKLLLSAITNPDLVNPWLAPLQKRRLPMSGIASAPLLQSALARRLRVQSPHLMLLTVHRRGGIRISYFRDGELNFSRLAVHPGAIDALAGTAHEEIVRTHQYLMSLRLTDRNSPIDVVCLLPEGSIEAWRAVQPSSGPLTLHHIGLGEMARLAGIKQESASRSADDLLIALLLQSGFPNHLAPPGDRHDHHIYRLRRGLVAASGIVALAATAASAALAYGAFDHHRRTEETRASTQALDTQVEQVRAKHPQTSAPVEEVKEAIRLTDSLQAENAPSRRLLADISRGFDAVPQAELASLGWTSSEHPKRVVSDDVFTATAEQAQAGSSDGTDPASTGKRWVAVAKGEILGAPSYRKANALADDLANAIRHPENEVEVLQYPFNINPDQELKVDLDKDIPERLPFKLRVIWKR
ncbi:MAG TPA: hypothetical protein VFF03_05150 [Rhodocyclaceae bacterium]|nr:hypothetical protein [Rhodocyclaceae bacterium]